MNITLIKPGLWHLDVRLMVSGKAYRVREQVQGGAQEARARFYEIRKELKNRAKEKKRSLTLTTFKDIIEYYVDRSCIDEDSKTYLKKIKEDLGNVEISELRERFDKYLLLLRHTKSKNTKRFLANNTINRYIAWAKAAVNFCVRAGFIKENPLQHFQKLPAYPRDRMLTDDEKKRLLEVVKVEAPHIYPITLFSLLVPSRVGELVTLKRTDYDMVNNSILIPGDRTKMKRPCIKPVPACLVDYMRNVPVESEYLFYRQDWRGKYLWLGDFRGAWRRCCKIAGIENYRFHDQRRTAYTDLLLAGNAPHIVMQVSGHKTDMSKVYFGRNELLAARSLQFGQNLYSTPVLQMAVTV